MSEPAAGEQPIQDRVHARTGLSLRVRVLLTAAFAIAFVVARLPAYQSPQWGEEGMFSHLLLEAPPGPSYLLISRVAGENSYCIPEHPGPLYEVIKLAGAGFRAAVPQWRAMTDQALTGRLRFTQSLFQLVFFSALLWIVLRPGRSSTRVRAAWIPGALVVAVALSQLAIRSSTGLQVDGAAGVLLVGVLPLVLLSNHLRPMTPAAFLAAAFLASLLTGLGKQEWSMALVAASGTTLAVGGLVGRLRPGVPSPPHRSGLLAMLLGCAAGNLASFAADRVNWRGGLDVMSRIAAEPGRGQGTGLGYQLQLMAERLPFYFVVLLLIVLVLVTLPRRLREREPWTVFLATYGIALAAGFLVSWRTTFDPRYFAPAITVLLGAALLGLDGDARAWARFTALAVIVAVAVPSVVSIRSGLRSSRRAGQEFDRAAAFVLSRRGADGCVPILPTGSAYHPSVEFVADSIGEDYARRLAADHGKTLCPR
jgi:hypothetical protein